MSYAQQGLSVIPLQYPIRTGNGFICSCGRVGCSSPAKHPAGHLVPNGLRDATTDTNIVASWFEDAPWNLGLVTGGPTGVFVLDVDPRHGGDESISRLEQIHGPFPLTWRFLTGGGGEHLVFRVQEGVVKNSAQKIAPGIDVRGHGGYIVAPPSRHISGRPYSISVDHHPADVPLAEAPLWLLQAVAEPQHNRRGQARADLRPLTSTPLPEGERNDSLTRLCGYLLSHAIDAHICLDILLSLNQTHCRPPLSEAEVTSIAASITSRELSRRMRRKEWNLG
jgi:Bifunctional DNA primase/polymerase, N-terminal/Primase C terminal 1 (PriCT-1)